MNLLKKLFGKKNKKQQAPSTSAFGKTSLKESGDLSKSNIRSEVAFKQSVSQALNDVRRKIHVEEDDFRDIDFNDNLDLYQYPLGKLSDIAKNKILEIIKIDMQYSGNNGVSRMQYWQQSDEGKSYTDQVKKLEENEKKKN